MGRYAALASLASCVLLMMGCGSAPPSEATIYYDPALRPGIVDASGAERELLARLAEAEAGEPLRIGDRTYVADPTYHAASGRRCRAVRADGGAARLACEAEDGWVFVPDVLAAGDAP